MFPSSSLIFTDKTKEELRLCSCSNADRLKVMSAFRVSAHGVDVFKSRYVICHREPGTFF